MTFTNLLKSSYFEKKPTHWKPIKFELVVNPKLTDEYQRKFKDLTKLLCLLFQKLKLKLKKTQISSFPLCVISAPDLFLFYSSRFCFLLIFSNKQNKHQKHINFNTSKNYFLINRKEIKNNSR